MSDKTGGAAFPHPDYDSFDDATKRWGWACASGGMTLRDWFAGQAAANMVNDDGWGTVANIAKHAYDLADALLSARDEG